MLSVGPHIFPMVPAALALAMRSRCNLYAQPFVACHLSTTRLGYRSYGSFRGNQHKTQFFSKKLQIGGQVAFTIQGDFSAQRAFDLAPGTGFFHALVYSFFHTVEPAPIVAAQLGVVRQCGKPLVPGFVEHSIAAFSWQVLPDFVSSEAQNRRNPAHKRLSYVVQRSLAGAPCQTVCLSGVL